VTRSPTKGAHAVCGLGDIYRRSAIKLTLQKPQTNVGSGANERGEYFRGSIQIRESCPDLKSTIDEPLDQFRPLTGSPRLPFEKQISEAELPPVDG
jgi:hypothetical protein